MKKRGKNYGPTAAELLPYRRAIGRRTYRKWIVEWILLSRPDLERRRHGDNSIHVPVKLDRSVNGVDLHMDAVGVGGKSLQLRG